MIVGAFMVMMLMVGTARSAVADIPGYILLHKVPGVAGASADDINTSVVQYLDRTGANSSCQHQADALTGQGVGNVRLAAASLGGRQYLYRTDLFIVGYRVDLVKLAMTEMVVNLVVGCNRNSNFHS